MADDLTPTELARLIGMERRQVISKCMELGVPIFKGKIDRTLFLTSYNANWDRRLGAMSDLGAAYFVIFDSSGNMIDSFESAAEAARAAQAIAGAEGGHRHFEVIAYDADGDVIEPRAAAPTSAAG